MLRVVPFCVKLGRTEELTRAWTVKITVAPEASDPLHDSVAPAIGQFQPPTASTDRSVIPAGTVSLTSTFEESLGPLLCAVIV